MTLHVSATTGCNMGCSYTTCPEARVLTADLEWKEMQNLELGDEVLSFDNPDYREKNKHLKLRTEEVYEKHEYKKPVVRVHTDKGNVKVAAKHPFLSKHHGWREAKDFKEGQEIRFLVKPEDYEGTDEYNEGYICGAWRGDGTLAGNYPLIRCNDQEIPKQVSELSEGIVETEFKTKYLSAHGQEAGIATCREKDKLRELLETDSEPVSDDFARGWLAGMFDTDGSFDGKTIRFNQEKEDNRKKIISMLETLGYKDDIVVEEGAIRLSPGYGGKFDLLTEIRPNVSRKVRKYKGKAWKGQATVQKVEHLGEQRVCDAAVTNNHTLCVEGFMSMNCYEDKDRQRKQEWVDRQYDIDKIMEKLEDWKDKHPNEPPGMHGGEPLLVRKEHLEQIFEYAHEHWDKPSHIQTNGTLMDEEHIEMFEKYNVSVGISCDGPGKLSDLRKAAGERDTDADSATEKMTEATHEAIEMCLDADVGLGIITVLHEVNAGTEERFEKLLDWMDDICERGASGHFNPAIPYDDINDNEDVALDRETLKDRYLRAWEWYKEEPYREWGPMRSYVDNLLGNGMTNCTNQKCDVANAGAAKIIKGDGETTGCFDKETDVLTEKGWIPIPEIEEHHSIGTIDPDTHELEFHNPTAIQEYDYDGKMLHWNTRASDIMVTPDHNMYTTRSPTGDWISMSAEDLSEYSEMYFKKSPSKISDSETYIPDINEVLPINEDSVETAPNLDEWLRFLGWYIAEGWHKNGNVVCIAQSGSSRYVEDVSDSLEPFGVVRSYPSINQYRINSEPVSDIVSQFTGCENKKIPQWCKKLPPQKIKQLLIPMFKGDGTSTDLEDGDPDKWTKYTTTSRELADDLQEMLLRIGKSGSITVQDEPTKGGKTRYDVSVVHHTQRTRITEGPEKVDYSGKVYDVTVPNHTLVVRRGGRVAISKNCGKSWDQYGDGGAFLQGDSTGNQYDEDEERYEVLKQTPGWVTEDAPDMGGCKGCEYWNVCQGGCPGAGQDDDYRNRTHFCKAKYALYEKVEDDLRTLMPNIRLITDLPWNANANESAANWSLNIKPFAAIDPGEPGRSSATGGYEHQYGPVQDTVPDSVMPDMSFEEKVRQYEEEHGEDVVIADPETGNIHADSAMPSIEESEEDKSEDNDGWQREDRA